MLPMVSSSSGGTSPLRNCDHCGSPGRALRKCVGCSLVGYCSKDCQKAAWPEHECVFLPLFLTSDFSHLLHIQQISMPGRHRLAKRRQDLHQKANRRQVRRLRQRARLHACRRRLPRRPRLGILYRRARARRLQGRCRMAAVDTTQGRPHSSPSQLCHPGDPVGP